jgi:hypothetical protein
MPSATFNIYQYMGATSIYLLLAAIVASIFPFRGSGREWKAFILGVCLPAIIAGLISTQRPGLISPRGLPISGTLLDLMSLF